MELKFNMINIYFVIIIFSSFLFSLGRRGKGGGGREEGEGKQGEGEGEGRGGYFSHWVGRGI